VHLILFAALVASSFASYQNIGVYASGDCSGDPIGFTSLQVSSGCVAVACIGASGYSTQTTCTDAIDAPSGLVGYSSFTSSDCTGSPTEFFGYATSGGCVTDPVGSGSASANCNSNGGFTYSLYSSNDCSGSPSNSAVYSAGCTTVGTGSYEQSSCETSSSGPDWKGLLATYLNSVGSNGWSIPTFSGSVYQSNSAWTNTDTSAQTTITFSAVQTGDIIVAFVDKVCQDVLAQATGGVCNAAGGACVSNPNSVHITCSWTVASATKRQTSSDSAKSINFVADMNNGVALSGLFALCLSLMVLLF